MRNSVDKLSKQKKSGLVFENHLPECTPLYDVPIKNGSKVALKTGKINDIYTILAVSEGKAVCVKNMLMRPLNLIRMNLFLSLNLENLFILA